jgi:hypothetical protein
MKFVKILATRHHEHLKDEVVAALQVGTIQRGLRHFDILAVLGMVAGLYVGAMGRDRQQRAREVLMANFEMGVKDMESGLARASEH